MSSGRNTRCTAWREHRLPNSTTSHTPPVVSRMQDPVDPRSPRDGRAGDRPRCVQMGSMDEGKRDRVGYPIPQIPARALVQDDWRDAVTGAMFP
jgi:hypothetical protein